MKLAGKNIWITGSSGGIGLAMALQAICEGASAIALSGSHVEKLEKAFATCSDQVQSSASKTQILPLCFDISKPHEIKTAVEKLWQNWDRLDILVHNAGLSQRATMLNTALEVEHYLMDVNYWGAVEITKLLLPKMLQNKRCYIGVNSSVAGLFGVPLRTTYCASKHALNGYFTALQAECYKQGLRVTILCPGKINTDISKSALTGDGSRFGYVERSHERGLSAQRCSAIFWHSLRCSRLVCYAVRSEALAIFLHRLSPQLGALLIRKVLPLREAQDQKNSL